MKYISALIFSVILAGAAAAQTTLVPFFDARSRGLMGGVENGQYLDAKTTHARLKGEGRYTLYGLKGRTGQLTATIEAPEANEPCEDFYYANTPLERRLGVALGAGHSWNPVPRPIKSLNLKDKTYLAAVAGILRAKGLRRAVPKLEQAVRVDLDGDGTDEVVLTASSYGGKIAPSAKAGDYSLVLVRKLVGGKVANLVIAEEYIKKTVEFGAPSRFEVSGLLDLNGDGRMELVMYGEYYEGGGAGVFEIKEREAVEIEMLQTACGV